jgi:MYXO-CTERM domain-containing protein
MGTTGGAWSQIGAGTPFTPAFPGLVALFNAEEGVKIHHNSFLITDYGSPTNDAACLSMAGSFGEVESVRWNIFASLRANTKVMYLDLGADFPERSDFNCFYYPNGIFSANFVSLSNWRSAASTAGKNLDAGSFVDNPRYRDTSSGSVDLRLESVSPCINVAFGSQYAIDLFGTQRPQGASRDVGAYEVVGGGGQPGTISISTPGDGLPAAVEGTNYDYAAVNATASGTSGNYTWSLSGAPAWLSISGTGLTGTFSGTPPGVASNVQFSATVADAAAPSVSATRNFTIQVLASGTIVISEPGSLPNATVGESYSVTLKAIGGSGSHTWSIAAGPSWLSISGSTDEAVLSNSSDVSPSGSFVVEITVTDGTSSGSRNFNLTVESAPPPPRVGSGGGGGCSVNGGSSLWLTALAAIGGFALMRRRRRVTA